MIGWRAGSTATPEQTSVSREARRSLTSLWRTVGKVLSMAIIISTSMDFLYKSTAVNYTIKFFRSIANLLVLVFSHFAYCKGSLAPQERWCGECYIYAVSSKSFSGVLTSLTIASISQTHSYD